MVYTQGTIRDVSVTDCWATNYGGGVHFQSQQLAGLRGLNISSCQAGSYGAALNLVQGTTSVYYAYRAMALFSIFSENSGEYCVSSYRDELVTFQSCAFFNNALSLGVIWSYRGYVAVLDAIFRNNAAEPFSGLTAYGSNYFLVFDCVFDTYQPVDYDIFTASASNSWYCETGVARFSVTRRSFTNPPVSQAPFDFPTYSTASLRSGRPSYGT
jgi:hypothetical protein